MGYEKMERRFPCPCGKGTQISEWEEHDTWVHGDTIGPFRLECEDCAARYESHWRIVGGQVWVLKEEKNRLDSLESQVMEKEAKLKALGVQDSEVSGIMSEIDSLKKEIDEFKRRMEKVAVPDRRGNVRKISS